MRGAEAQTDRFCLALLGIHSHPHCWQRPAGHSPSPEPPAPGCAQIHGVSPHYHPFGGRAASRPGPSLPGPSSPRSILGGLRCGKLPLDQFLRLNLRPDLRYPSSRDLAGWPRPESSKGMDGLFSVGDTNGALFSFRGAEITDREQEGCAVETRTRSLRPSLPSLSLLPRDTADETRMETCSGS